MSAEDEIPSPEELKKMLEAAKAHAEQKRQEQRQTFEKHITSDNVTNIQDEAEKLQQTLDEDLRKRKERASQAVGRVPPRAT